LRNQDITLAVPRVVKSGAFKRRVMTAFINLCGMNRAWKSVRAAWREIRQPYLEAHLPVLEHLAVGGLHLERELHRGVQEVGDLDELRLLEPAL
jgi:hypothetical protein